MIELIEISQINTLKVITESKNNNVKYKLVGTFLTFDTYNANGRLYPYEVCKDSFEEFSKNIHKKDFIYKYCEYEHSIHRNPNNNITEIYFDYVVGKVTEINFDKKYVKGVIDILPLDKNKSNYKVLKSLYDRLGMGFNIGVSLRALGSVDELGRVTEFYLYGFDVVKDASDYNARNQEILTESKKYTKIDNKFICDNNCKIKKIADLLV